MLVLAGVVAAPVTIARANQDRIPTQFQLINLWRSPPLARRPEQLRVAGGVVIAVDHAGKAIVSFDAQSGATVAMSADEDPFREPEEPETTLTALPSRVDAIDRRSGRVVQSWYFGDGFKTEMPERSGSRILAWMRDERGTRFLVIWEGDGIRAPYPPWDENDAEDDRTDGFRVLKLPPGAERSALAGKVLILAERVGNRTHVAGYSLERFRDAKLRLPASSLSRLLNGCDYDFDSESAWLVRCTPSENVDDVVRRVRRFKDAGQRLIRIALDPSLTPSRQTAPVAAVLLGKFPEAQPVPALIALLDRKRIDLHQAFLQEAAVETLSSRGTASKRSSTVFQRATWSKQSRPTSLRSGSMVSKKCM